jgi:HAMP domain-containing protein
MTDRNRKIATDEDAHGHWIAAGWQNGRVEKLERFFKEVADLTFSHKVLADTAVVYSSVLGEALALVDPDWIRKTDDRRGDAMQAHYRLSTLTRCLPLPKGTRYAVRCADDYKSVTVILVSKRMHRRWPNWDKIAPLVPCAQIIEDEDPITRAPRKTLYF